MTPTDLVSEMKSRVSYLRVDARTDVDPELGWLSCPDLVHDGAHLLEVVRSTAAGRGTDRDDIALSLFAQAYAFRIASVAIGGWLVGNDILDISPDNTAIALGRHRPNAVALDEVRFSSESLHRSLFDGHLTPFVETAHRMASTIADNRVGQPLLWGNVATGCAAAFGAFGQAGPRAIQFFDGAPDPVRQAGQYEIGTDDDGNDVHRWARNSCCLWFQIPADNPFHCEDCPRKPTS